MRDKGWKGVRERLRDREGGEERERERRGDLEAMDESETTINYL